MAKKVDYESTVIAKIPWADSIEDIKELAKEMRLKFPALKMQDGVTPWRSGIKEMTIKLVKAFDYFDLYDYNREDILKATETYVRNFTMKGYFNMRCSKYFIMKYIKDTGETISDLATTLENMSEEDKPSVNTDTEWLDKLFEDV